MAAKRTPVNLEEWAVSMMERHNRRSHLAPPLSPNTQGLLKSNGDTPTPDANGDFGMGGLNIKEAGRPAFGRSVSAGIGLPGNVRPAPRKVGTPM